jgi:hypothetical protein
MTLNYSNLTDIGVNLTNDRFNKDLADTLQRSHEAGVLDCIQNQLTWSNGLEQPSGFYPDFTDSLIK